jgi:acetyl-CoA synthetase
MKNLNNTDKFLSARNFLLQNRLDYDKVRKEFVWPEFSEFNWARDWFDVYAKGNLATALWIRKDKKAEVKLSYDELSRRSNQVASFLQNLGVKQNDRIIMLLPNVVPIWELMLASIKIGAIMVPTSTLATKDEISDRIIRSGAKFLFTNQECLPKLPESQIKVVFCDSKDYERAYDEKAEYKINVTMATDPLFYYFTSGTTSKAKLVQHTHQSYPVGHLTTMYWVGIQEGDIHQNISSPGWAKHAWSCFFAPFNAGATSFIYDQDRFNAANTMKTLNDVGVNTLCAPPTVWRMMILENLGQKPKGLREIASAGEPLNPEVIEKVEGAWGIKIRDGYGQTETTAQIGNSPGQIVKLGSMGRPLPGCSIAIINSEDQEANEGEVAIRLNSDLMCLMKGYVDDEEKTNRVMKNNYYRTGDEASVDEDGYIFFVGRGDDVFKSSDYRISPFELESALLEHTMIAEAAVVPSPDDVRTSVPKAYITLKPGIIKNAETAKDILLFAKESLPPYKRIRKIEFFELPKTISGKIRRVELRKREAKNVASSLKGEFEFWLSEF